MNEIDVAEIVEDISISIIDQIYSDLPEVDESHLASVIISLDVNNE